MGELSTSLRYACVCALLLIPIDSSAETRLLRSGDDLQAAINAAQPGDTLLLEPGASFIGNFLLPEKSGAAYITIRTDTTSVVLPKAGIRIRPSDAASLAKLRSPNTSPALRTAPRAHHWRLQLLEFGPNLDGMGEIVRFGDGAQTSLADVPYEIEVDRCYIHGDPSLGQKRGLSLQSASTKILSSTISDIKAIGMDTQAIGGWNGPGPYVIENNYLEGAGENVMFGGADPTIDQLVPSDITFRNNHVRKPVEWRQDIIAAPASVAASAGPTGSLVPDSYYYRVVARRPAGQGQIASSAGSAEVAASLTASGGVQVSWAVVPGATEYRVYRRTATAASVFWTVKTNGYTDSGGTAGTAGVPGASGSKWSVKNLFELKNARRVTIVGNVFENNWVASQTGYGILLKSWNQDGKAPWSVVEDVLFTHNIVRHVSSAINVLGYGAGYPTQQLRNLTIANNIFDDVSSANWAGDGRFVMIGDAPANVTIDHNTVSHTGMVLNAHGGAVQGFTYTNNLTHHNQYGVKGDGTGVGNATLNTYFPGALFARNALAGGNALLYPADDLFPTVSSYDAEFADADYHLQPASTFRGAGTDGLDLGANIDDVLAQARIATGGSDRSNLPPIALAGGPYAGMTLTGVAVDGRASSDPDGAIVSFTWSWGDGSADSTGASAGHVYARAGLYTVTLTVVDDEGASSRATATMDIGNRAPVADAGGPYSGQVAAIVTVNGSRSSDADGVIAGYTWSWGDGTADSTGAAAAASHVYASAGDFVVTLTVVDDHGSAGSANTVVTIAAPPPPPTTPAVTAPEIVIYPSELPSTALHGSWTRVADATAAGGAKLATADAAFVAANAALASPQHYFDATFDAHAGVEYRVWLRLSATANNKYNDSVWVQFSDAIDASGLPLYPTGSTSALLVNLASTSTATELNGWGWQNGAYWLSQTTTVKFPSNGSHAMRVQVREDGVQIDQIVLSPIKYLDRAPGASSNDATIVPKQVQEVVLHAADVTTLKGDWQKIGDTTAAGGLTLYSPNLGQAWTSAPLASPAQYFEATAQVQANVDYRIWIRMKALNNDKRNDSVWVQFSDATSNGVAVHRIGSTNGLLVNLATTGAATSLRGWGWQNGAYWLTETQQTSLVRFSATGVETIRVQVREDGLAIDQIVLSPVKYLQSAPGPVTGDTTIVPRP